MDQADTIEVAVDKGKVIINYRGKCGPDGWGHFSFNVEQATALIKTLQAALQQAKSRN